MNSRTLSLTLLAGLSSLLLLSACGGKPKPEAPAPQSSPNSTDGSMGPSAPSGTVGGAPTAGDAAAAEAARRREAAARARATIEQKVYFEFDQAGLSATSRSLLDAKLDVLRSFPAVALTISGHADERGSDEYNLALGSRRAAAAKQYLVSHGVTGGRLQVTSYGEEKPASFGSDETAWSQNRRAEFQVSAGLE